MMATKTNSLWHKVAGNWKQFAGDVRRRWGLLTDDDMDVIRGDRDILIGKLQERYGYPLDIAQQKVNEWENSLS
jgi:uncharacterized protein YjbJ (UPF0337 family)